MGFDIQGAKQAGYSDAEIADYLAKEHSFDAQGARKSGYSDAEIITHLQAPQPQQGGEQLPESDNQWVDTPSGSRRVLKAPNTTPQMEEPSLMGDDLEMAQDIVEGNPATRTLANVIPSGGAFLKNIVTPFMHPMDTAEGIGRAVVGGVEKLIPGQQADEKVADAVGQFFKDRYGGTENIAKTIETDPVGFLTDLSGVLGLGSAATASKLPGLSKVLGSAAQVTDPAAIAGGLVNNPVNRAVANKLTGQSLDKGLPFSDKRAMVNAGEELNALRGGNPEQQALDAKRLAEVNALKQRIPGMPNPSYGQASGNMAVAAREQGLTRTGENMQRFTYNDSTVNDAALDNFLNNVGPERELPYGVSDKQTQGRNLSSTIEAKRRVAKQGVEDAYSAIPDEPVESIGIKKVADEIQSEKDFLTDAEYPGWAINKINKIFGKGKGKPEYSYSYESGTTEKPVTNVEVPFQELHAFRKELGQAIRNAEVGANPNFALSRNLKKLKGAIDDAIDVAGSGGNLADSYTAAKQAYTEYANRFKTGVTDKVLKRGKQITGLNVPDEQIAQRFWSADGADDLNRAIGKKVASSAMREYAASEVMPFLEKETPDIKGALKWMVKNKAQIAKYGLEGELKELIKSQVPAAIRKNVESARINIRENPQLTITQVKRVISDYGPALRILYKDNPGALKSLVDYHKVLQVLARNKAVSYSKGSNTAEKLTAGRMFAEGATLTAIWAGKGWIFSSAKNIIRGLVNGPVQASQAKIERLLLDATFDPQIAEQLMALAKNPRNKKAIDKINKWVGKVGRAGAQNAGQNRYNKQSQPINEDNDFDE